MSYRARLFNNALVNALGGVAGGRCTDYLSNTIKCALLDDTWTPDPDLEVYGDLSGEITESGYTAGGASLSAKSISYSASQVAQWMKFKADPATWGFNFTTPRYAVLYNATPTDKPLLGWADAGHVIAGSEDDDAFEVRYDNTFGLYDKVWFSIATDPPNGFSGLGGQFSWVWFSRAWGNIFGGLSSGQARQTDFPSDAVNVALLTSSWTPAGSEQVWADVSTYEVDGSGGYAAQALSGKTLAFDSATRRTVLGSDDMVWSGATITGARWAVWFNDTPTDKPLLGYLPLTEDRGTAGGEFRIKVNPSGVLTVNVT